MTPLLVYVPQTHRGIRYAVGVRVNNSLMKITWSSLETCHTSHGVFPPICFLKIDILGTSPYPLIAINQIWDQPLVTKNLWYFSFNKHPFNINYIRKNSTETEKLARKVLQFSIIFLWKRLYYDPQMFIKVTPYSIL